MEQARRALPNWLLALACALPYVGFWAYGLFDLDEGFYGAVTVDMIRRGDWITPTLNGAPWFEKPILSYWLSIPSVLIFGEAVGPRLPSVVCTLVLAWLLYRFVRREAGETAAQLAALGYASSLLVVAVGRMMLTDAPFVLALFLAFTAYWDSLQGKPSKRPLAAFWLGVAVLAKGPVAGVFFLAIAGITAWRQPATRASLRGGWALGMLVFAAVVASWYVPCYLANGRLFVDEFLIEQNIGRFTGGDEAHRVPVWAHPIFYPLVLALGTAPWWWGLVRRRAWSAVERYLILWAAVPFVLFTLSGSKLPHYILPSVAPMLAVAAMGLAAWARPERWLRFGVGWAVFVAVLANALFLAEYRGYRELHDLARAARESGLNVVVYQIQARGEGPRIQLERQETSQPSVLFYLRRPAEKIETLEELAASDGPRAVITREGRLSAEDEAALQRAGWRLRPLDVPQDRYRGFVMER